MRKEGNGNSVFISLRDLWKGFCKSIYLFLDWLDHCPFNMKRGNWCRFRWQSSFFDDLSPTLWRRNFKFVFKFEFVTDSSLTFSFNRLVWRTNKSSPVLIKINRMPSLVSLFSGPGCLSKTSIEPRLVSRILLFLMGRIVQWLLWLLICKTLLLYLRLLLKIYSTALAISIFTDFPVCMVVLSDDILVLYRLRYFDISTTHNCHMGITFNTKEMWMIS